jgi:hypothetical protein
MNLDLLCAMSTALVRSMNNDLLNQLIQKVKAVLTNNKRVPYAV